MSAAMHRFGSLAHGICDECDDPVAVNTFGWYRCRSCGFESLRPLSKPANNTGASAPQARRALGLSLSPTSQKGSRA